MGNLPAFEKTEYTKYQKQVKLVNAVYDGVDTTKEYLLQYNKEENTDYVARQNASNLDNFVFRTIDTMKNIVFRKDIDISGITNTKLLEWADEIDLVNGIDYFAKQVFENARKDGYTFIMVDSQSYNDEEITTKQQIDSLKIRPYLINVKREDVVFWDADNIELSTVVIIKESIKKIDYVNFIETSEVQYRAIYSNGRVRIYDKDGNYSEVQTQLNFLPLIKVGNRDIPEFYDQAKLNISHFNRSSELDNYVRVGGAPFLAVGGQRDKENTPSTLAINKGIQFRDENFKIEWVEMSGQNAVMIEKRIKSYEDAMMKQAIEFVTGESNKTATQTNKEAMPKESKLKEYAKELEEALNKALWMMGEFIVNGLGENTLSVNKDFDSSLLTAQQAESYRQDYLNNIISLERLWKLYEQGEYLPKLDESEIEKEKMLIKDNQV